MSLVLEQRPAMVAAPDRAGRGPARRAVVRWAWRLFRREWRQQLLVLALLTLAVAATTAGLAVAATATPPAEATFTLPGSDPQLAGDVVVRHSSDFGVLVDEIGIRLLAGGFKLLRGEVTTD